MSSRIVAKNKAIYLSKETQMSKTYSNAKTKSVAFFILAAILAAAIVLDAIIAYVQSPENVIRGVATQTSNRLTLQNTYTFDSPLEAVTLDGETWFYAFDNNLLSRNVDSGNLNWQYSSKGARELWGVRTIEIYNNRLFIMTSTIEL